MKKTMTMALGLAAALAATGAALADAKLARQLVMTPGKGVSFYMGSKHGITHFTAQDGACNLTVAIGEQPAQDGMNPTGSARVQVAVVPGKPARVGTSEGQVLVFDCAPDAQSMKLDMPENVKFKAQ